MAAIGGATMSIGRSGGVGAAVRGSSLSSHAAPKGVEHGSRTSGPITFSSRSFADLKPGMFNHAAISKSSSSIINKSEVSKGINRFAFSSSPSRTPAAERHISRPSFDRPKFTGREKSRPAMRGIKEISLPTTTNILKPGEVRNVGVVGDTRVAEPRMSIPRPARLEHGQRIRSRETAMRSRVVSRKDMFSHVGRQEIRLQGTRRVEGPRSFVAPKNEVRESGQITPRKDSQMSLVGKKDFKNLVFSRIKTSPNTMAALSIDFDVAQAEKVVRIKQVVFPKISESQLQAQTVNSLVERYKNKTGVVVFPEVQVATQQEPEAEVQPQVDTSVQQKTQAATLEQNEENKKKVETAVLKNGVVPPKEKKKFYFVEDVKAKAERVKAAVLAASNILKYRKEGEKVTGKDVSSQMGQLGKDAISEVVHPRSHDGTLDQNLKELEAFGEFESVEEVQACVEESSIKPVRLSLENHGETVSQSQAEIVYGASLREQDAYFKDNNRASGEFQIEEGATWFVPKTQAVAGEVA